MELEKPSGLFHVHLQRCSCRAFSGGRFWEGGISLPPEAAGAFAHPAAWGQLWGGTGGGGRALAGGTGDGTGLGNGLPFPATDFSDPRDLGDVFGHGAPSSPPLACHVLQGRNSDPGTCWNEQP